jgi:DNA-binding MarR family transcriptional regulator
MRRASTRAEILTSRAPKKPAASAAAAPLRSVPTRKPSPTGSATHPVVDLEQYVPAYFSWIANKLSGGASQAYLSVFDVGIETWRLLVLLAIEKTLSAQRIAHVIGMDKASVSRAFKSMYSRGLITIGLDTRDGRLRVAALTTKGRALHDQILDIALQRERAFVSVLTAAERNTLIALLHRLHDNLPAVEEATAGYLAQHYPHAKLRRRGPRSSEDVRVDHESYPPSGSGDACRGWREQADDSVGYP